MNIYYSQIERKGNVEETNHLHKKRGKLKIDSIGDDYQKSIF
jgi:hypothetical protein